MKSPYRKGVQITISNAALQAAATITANVYRGVDQNTPGRIMNLAAALVDEIEARSQPTDSTGTTREEVAEAA